MPRNISHARVVRGAMPVRGLGKPSHSNVSLTHVKRGERKEGWLWCGPNEVLARWMMSPPAIVTTGGVLHSTPMGWPWYPHHAGSLAGRSPSEVWYQHELAVDPGASVNNVPQNQRFSWPPTPHAHWSRAPSHLFVCFFITLILLSNLLIVSSPLSSSFLTRVQKS